MTGSHFIAKCPGCGTVSAQCRCPSPDKEVRPVKCLNWPECALPPSDSAEYHKAMAIEYRADLSKTLLEVEAMRARAVDAEGGVELAAQEVERLRAELENVRKDLAIQQLYVNDRNYLAHENVKLRVAVARVGICVDSAEQRPETWNFRDFVSYIREAAKISQNPG